MNCPIPHPPPPSRFARITTHHHHRMREGTWECPVFRPAAIVNSTHDRPVPCQARSRVLTSESNFEDRGRRSMANSRVSKPIECPLLSAAALSARTHNRTQIPSMQLASFLPFRPPCLWRVFLIKRKSRSNFIFIFFALGGGAGMPWRRVSVEHALFVGNDPTTHRSSMRHPISSAPQAPHAPPLG